MSSAGDYIEYLVIIYNTDFSLKRIKIKIYTYVTWELEKDDRGSKDEVRLLRINKGLMIMIKEEFKRKWESIMIREKNR